MVEAATFRDKAGVEMRVSGRKSVAQYRSNAQWTEVDEEAEAKAAAKAVEAEAKAEAKAETEKAKSAKAGE